MNKYYRGRMGREHGTADSLNDSCFIRIQVQEWGLRKGTMAEDDSGKIYRG
jgi:hypothetical protein